jgi:hypothetical protein
MIQVALKRHPATVEQTVKNIKETFHVDKLRLVVVELKSTLNKASKKVFEN